MKIVLYSGDGAFTEASNLGNEISQLVAFNLAFKEAILTDPPVIWIISLYLILSLSGIIYDYYWRIWGYFCKYCTFKSYYLRVICSFNNATTTTLAK